MLSVRIAWNVTGPPSGAPAPGSSIAYRRTLLHSTTSRSGTASPSVDSNLPSTASAAPVSVRQSSHSGAIAGADGSSARSELLKLVTPRPKVIRPLELTNSAVGAGVGRAVEVEAVSAQRHGRGGVVLAVEDREHVAARLQVDRLVRRRPRLVAEGVGPDARRHAERRGVLVLPGLAGRPCRGPGPSPRRRRPRGCPGRSSSHRRPRPIACGSSRAASTASGQRGR